MIPKNLSPKWQSSTIAKLKKLAPAFIVLIISFVVSGFNLLMARQKELLANNSIAAKLLANNPGLNPQLNEKQKLANARDLVKKAGLAGDNTGNSRNIFINIARAANLTDDDQSDKKPFEYEVQGGDTLTNIAQKYDLKLSTILWANGLNTKSVINPGQKLTLLPTDGVLYTIARGDTIGKIALRYKTESQKVMDYNDIADAAKIHAGDAIIIPDSQPLPASPSIAKQPNKPNTDSGLAQNDYDDNIPPVVAVPAVTGKLLWPTTTRNLTQKYSAKHRGIDISNGQKPPIFAAETGTVEFAGKSGDWGNTILIRDDDDLVIRYSHASKIDVSVGDHISAGDPIGVVGNTGRVRGATGLHLDFRVYRNGVAINPLNLLE